MAYKKPTIIENLTLSALGNTVTTIKFYNSSNHEQQHSLICGLSYLTRAPHFIDFWGRSDVKIKDRVWSPGHSSSVSSHHKASVQWSTVCTHSKHLKTINHVLLIEVFLSCVSCPKGWSGRMSCQPSCRRSADPRALYNLDCLRVRGRGVVCSHPSLESHPC